MRRSLAILSVGMLSDSQRRSLTLLSEGWLAVALVPEEGITSRRRRNFAYVAGKNFLSNIKKVDNNDKRKKNDDEEIMGVIRTFMTWVN